jgi:hypothetical protein
MGSVIIYSAKGSIIAALREYKNAMQDLGSSSKPYSEREINANRKFDSLIELLNNEPADPNSIVYKDVDFDSILDDGNSGMPRFAGFEAQIISSALGGSIVRSKQVIFRVGREIAPMDFNAPLALAASLAVFHHDAMSRFRETVELAKKEKRKQRKKIFAAIEYITAGIALAIVNNTPIVPEMYRVPSSALGVGITLRGISDIRGA